MRRHRVLLRFLVVLSLAMGAALIPLSRPTSAQQQLPYDTGVVFRTHLAHVNANSKGKGGGGGGGGGGGDTTYTVGAVVTPTSTSPEAEEHIAVDPAHSQNLVAAISDFSGSNYNKTKFALSTNNGASWSEAFVPLAGGYPTADGHTWSANSDPVVAIDTAGNIYGANLYFNCNGCTYGGGANGLYVNTGTMAGGISSLIPHAVVAHLEQNPPFDEDKEWIAVDNSRSGYSGRVYVSWTRFAGNSDYIVVSHSLDHGLTWSAPIQVSPASQNGAVQGSQVAVGPSGTVYIVYEVFYVGGNRAQFLAKSDDGGSTFSAPIQITPLFKELSFNSTYRKDSFPALAVGSDGFVNVLYAGQGSGKRGGSAIYFVRSLDSGASFSNPVAISDTSSGDRLMPALAVDGGNVLHASWFDTRNSGVSSQYDIYATHNAVDVWHANVRVTPSLIDAGHTSFLGDYMGEAAGGGAAHPVWTDGGFSGGQLQTATLTLP